MFSYIIGIILISSISFSTEQQINPDQISKTVILNDTSFVAYNYSLSKCRIDCADVETMSNPEFRTFEKIWLFNDSEIFSADDKTFIDSNRSLEFQVLSFDDEGSYQCCIRSLDLAYQSYICYSTQLSVIDELPIDELNSTEAPLPPSWNVMIMDGSTLNCQPENNYFIKVFDENVTDIHCLVNHVNVDIKTGNEFPDPMFNDILITGFNVSEHSGVYICNGTIGDGNDTIIDTVQFTVSQSLDENMGAVLLDDSQVKDIFSISIRNGLIMIILLVLCQVWN